MKKYYMTPFFILMISTMVIGCGGEKVMNTASFEPYKFNANQYVPKVDNFVVILDTSSSMADKYGQKEKADIANELLIAMNRTLPELNYNGALLTFGHDAHLPDKSAMLVYDRTFRELISHSSTPISLI